MTDLFEYDWYKLAKKQPMLYGWLLTETVDNREQKLTLTENVNQIINNMMEEPEAYFPENTAKSSISAYADSEHPNDSDIDIDLDEADTKMNEYISTETADNSIMDNIPENVDNNTDNITSIMDNIPENVDNNTDNITSIMDNIPENVDNDIDITVNNTDNITNIPENVVNDIDITVNDIDNLKEVENLVVNNTDNVDTEPNIMNDIMTTNESISANMEVPTENVSTMEVPTDQDEIIEMTPPPPDEEESKDIEITDEQLTPQGPSELVIKPEVSHTIVPPIVPQIKNNIDDFPYDFDSKQDLKDIPTVTQIKNKLDDFPYDFDSNQKLKQDLKEESKEIKQAKQAQAEFFKSNMKQYLADALAKKSAIQFDSKSKYKSLLKFVKNNTIPNKKQVIQLLKTSYIAFQNNQKLHKKSKNLLDFGKQNKPVENKPVENKPVENKPIVTEIDWIKYIGNTYSKQTAINNIAAKLKIEHTKAYDLYNTYVPQENQKETKKHSNVTKNVNKDNMIKQFMLIKDEEDDDLNVRDLIGLVHRNNNVKI